jgi:hypothetical protein
LLKRDLGKAKAKPKFRDIFSKSRAINRLSAARLFLFGARDVWFVVALPVFLAQSLRLGLLAGRRVPRAVGHRLRRGAIAGAAGDGAPQREAPRWPRRLRVGVDPGRGAGADGAVAVAADNPPQACVLVAGLSVFGVLFAVNSSLHSYLIVSYAAEDGVSLDVGFYYMANAMGRLLGTMLSGWVFQRYGLAACLGTSAVFVALAAIVSLALPRHDRAAAAPAGNVDASE